jgi:hypothetical protein
LRPAPIDWKFGAGREGRIEREEEDGLRDFLRRPPALHRIDVTHLPRDLGSHVFLREHLVQDRRVDGAGRHRVNANLARQKLNSEHPSERPERSLGGSVWGYPGHSLDVCDGGREDDSATPVHRRRELLHREIRTLGVQG